MTKRQLIDQIITVNRSAPAAFLARFDDEDLRAYLDHLGILDQPRMTGDAARYAKYFVPPAPSKAAPATAPLDEPDDDELDDVEETDGVDEPDEQPAASQGPLWFASETNTADSDPQADRPQPAHNASGLAYDTEHTPSIPADLDDQADEDNYDQADDDDSPTPTAARDEQDQEEPDDELDEESDEEPDEELDEEPDGEPIAVGQYASPSTNEPDSDFESWLF